MEIELMGMVKKNITLTEQQETWLKAQIASGNYGNESEVLRDLIRQRMTREAEILTIRQALIDGEKSGTSQRTVDDIWEDAQRRHRTQNA
jgi:antitoxin ParD1/3/4